jgi:hypothetical protein
MTAVWALPLNDSEKIVLLALADCANDEGHCWPGMRSLVAKCSKSERTIQGAIQRLVDGGHLTRREVPGKGCNYTVHPRNNCTPAESAPPQGTTQTPAAVAGKPSRTVSTEAKASSQRVVDHWNKMAERHPKVAAVRVLDNSRLQTLRLRLKEHGEARLLEAIDLFDRSPFLCGSNRDSKWRPSIDFILQPASLRKVLEGTYGEDAPKGSEMSADEKIRRAEERAALYRRIGREDDAEEEMRSAARLRGDALPQSVGALAAKFSQGVRPQ